MRYNWLSALSLLTTAVLLPIAFTTLQEPRYDMKVKHTWNSVPVNWESQGHPPAGSLITLYIALKPERESALIDTLTEVSNPTHSRYGVYLSQDQVAELVRPHPDTVELITAWLVHHGIRSSSISTTHGGGWLTVSGVLVSQANELLGASYQLYRNTKTKDTVVRTVGYSLPAVLHAHIKTVAPTTYFPSTRVKRQTSRRRSLGGAPAHSASGKLVTAVSSRAYIGFIDPNFLRREYGTRAYQPTATDRNRLAVVGFNGAVPSHEDLTKFMTLFSKDAQAATFTIEQVNGGVNIPSHPDLANTGVQYAAAMAYPIPLVFYSVGGQSVWNKEDSEEGMLEVPIAGDKYLEWFHHVFREGNFPQTISISDGDVELALPPEYAANVCFLFAILGSKGVSVLTASGNDGVGKGECITDEGYHRFKAEFPSSCPYVTAVGGTKDLPEEGVYLSGGGFSEYFSRMEYQDNSVPNFILDLEALDLEGEYEGRFNSSNRGYPDIASQASIYQYVLNNKVALSMGTPCAVSTVAGIISLINDFLISRNKPPLGFLNPWLYGAGSAGLNDITSGNNPGCETAGFSAAPGWDPVTGLGTLNFETLLDVIVKSWPKEEQPP